LWRLFVAVFCMMQVMMYTTPTYLTDASTIAPDLRRLLAWAGWVLSLPVLLFSAAPMFREAWAGLKQRRIGMDLPVALAIAVTFIVSSGATFDPGGVFGDEAYFDSLTMFVSFLLAGRWVALRLQHRVAAALEGAVSRLPAMVDRLDADGRSTRVALVALRPGDRVRVPVGEAFPGDGPVIDGCSAADEALLTGESRPVRKAPGDEAIAGSINLQAPVVQRVDRLGAQTRYEGIAALVRDVLSQRPPMLRAADRVAGPFLAAVLVLSASAAVVWWFIDPSRAVWIAVSVLIVTCPCALSLAAPSAYLAAASALLRRGVLVQRLEALETLSGLDTLCFDKTGTLSEGRLRVATVVLQPAAVRAGLDAQALTALAASLARVSTHPLARALVDNLGAAGAPGPIWQGVRERPGLGIEAHAVDGRRYRLGAASWIAPASPPDTTADTGPQTWLGGPDGALARFGFVETLRPDAAATVQALRGVGLDIVLLSGDAAPRVAAVAATLGIDDAQGGLTPADKLHRLRALQQAGHRVGMVGDGLNDAPVTARADVSFAMGEGSTLTRSRADFILASGSLADIVRARQVARRTVRVVRQNLAWAAGYNLLCVPLALVGWFPPWAAGLGMATSSLVVVLNALRIDRRAIESVA
ncbi:MAG: heavy metal translocating P-type ATPase, partial [Rubrivivax sp.]